jgi:hypothetical protein
MRIIFKNIYRIKPIKLIILYFFMQSIQNYINIILYFFILH